MIKLPRWIPITVLLVIALAAITVFLARTLAASSEPNLSQLMSELKQGAYPGSVVVTEQLETGSKRGDFNAQDNPSTAHLVTRPPAVDCRCVSHQVVVWYQQMLAHWGWRHVTTYTGFGRPTAYAYRNGSDALFIYPDSPDTGLLTADLSIIPTSAR